MPAITSITSSATRAARLVRSHLKPTPWMAVAAIAVAAGGGGLAYAAVTPGEISACSNKTSGALRIAATCSATENPVSWNAVGPQGATGATGATGPVGPRGATGAKGADGILSTATGFRDSYDRSDGVYLTSSDLVVSRSSRVVADSTMSVIGSDGAGLAQCTLDLYSGTTFVGSFTRDSRLASVAAGEYQTLPLVGSRVVGAGTYQVHVNCWSSGLAKLRGEVVAFAAAT